MKTGIGTSDGFCVDCGVDAHAVKELLRVLNGTGGMTVVQRLRVGGYQATADRLQRAIDKVKV